MTDLQTLTALDDETPFGFLDGQYAYWRGFSGRRYIHTVYEACEIDAFAGAVAILLDAEGTVRHVVLIGEGASGFAARCEIAAAHVHFPAPGAGSRVCNDLRNALLGRLRTVAD